MATTGRTRDHELRKTGLADRIGGNRARLALARKLLKRSYHILNALGDKALEPAAH